MAFAHSLGLGRWPKNISEKEEEEESVDLIYVSPALAFYVVMRPWGLHSDHQLTFFWTMDEATEQNTSMLQTENGWSAKALEELTYTEVWLNQPDTESDYWKNHIQNLSSDGSRVAKERT